MPRQSRQPSGTGIFHIMMRGIRSSSARLLPQRRKNDPLDDDVQCLEFDERPRLWLSDDQVWMQIKEQTGTTSSTAFQQLADEVKRNILRQLKDRGASHRQLEGLEQREQCDARIDIAES